MMYANLDEFLCSNYRNTWLREGSLEIYVRRAMHKHPESNCLVPTLDIANINISDKRLRSKGVFSSWLTSAEALAQEHNLNVYVESVMNERLWGFLRKKGYIETAPYADAPSRDFWKYAI